MEDPDLNQDPLLFSFPRVEVPEAEPSGTEHHGVSAEIFSETDLFAAGTLGDAFFDSVLDESDHLADTSAGELEGGCPELQHTFGEVAGIYLSSLQQFFDELHMGALPTDWARPLLPSLRTVTESAQAMGLESLAGLFRSLLTTFEQAVAAGHSSIDGALRLSILEISNAIAAQLPESFAARERSTDSRDAALLQALLRQVPSLDDSGRIRLLATGLNSPRALAQAAPAELAVLAGLAEHLCRSCVRLARLYGVERAAREVLQTPGQWLPVLEPLVNELDRLERKLETASKNEQHSGLQRRRELLTIQAGMLALEMGDAELSRALQKFSEEGCLVPLREFIAELRRPLREELLQRRQTGESCQHLDLRGRQLAGIDLAGADLSGCDLRGADLSGANLTGAVLVHANLRGARLRGALLQNAQLRHASLDGADLSAVVADKADLSGAFLDSADLEGAHFARANLRRAVLTNTHLARSNFVAADLRQAKLDGAEIAGADFSKAVFTATEIPERSAPQHGSDGCLRDHCATAPNHRAETRASRRNPPRSWIRAIHIGKEMGSTFAQIGRSWLETGSRRSTSILAAALRHWKTGLSGVSNLLLQRKWGRPHLCVWLAMAALFLSLLWAAATLLSAAPEEQVAQASALDPASPPAEAESTRLSPPVISAPQNRAPAKSSPNRTGNTAPRRLQKASPIESGKIPTPFSPSTVPPAVKFSDPALEKCVRRALGQPSGEIQAAAAILLSTLDCSSAKTNAADVCNLEGLQNLEGLEYLDLSFNRIEDIGPLASLHKIKRLNLRGNRIQDITPVGGLPAQCEIDLWQNPIGDITPLLRRNQL